MKNADILRAAKARIEEHGWGQGNGAIPPTGCYCVLTAIGGDERCYHLDAVDLFERANNLHDAHGRNGTIEWNDAPERTKEEVLAAFDKAITLAEQENA